MCANSASEGLSTGARVGVRGSTERDWTASHERRCFSESAMHWWSNNSKDHFAQAHSGASRAFRHTLTQHRRGLTSLCELGPHSVAQASDWRSDSLSPFFNLRLDRSNSR